MSGRTLLIATLNEGKLREFRRQLADLPLTILSLKDFADFRPAPETGRDFAENATAKAAAAAAATGLPTVADDSGLEVDALDGGPGIYSARYGGVGLDDDGRNQLLLQQLAGVEPAGRTARYRVVLALVAPGAGTHQHSSLLIEGTVEGWIGFEPKGDGGFGYDPIFYLFGDRGERLDRSMAQLSPAEKDAISHRGRALRRLRQALPATDWFRDRPS